MLALDGRPGPWLPPGFDLVPQRGEGLAERLAAAFDDAGGPALLVGMDTPQISTETLVAACERLCAPGVDAVIGLAADGGWWALGLRTPDRRAFAGVPMSASSTGAAQLRALERLGLAPERLETMRDVDTIEDAVAVAASIPRSRFAATLRRLTATGAAAAR